MFVVPILLCLMGIVTASSSCTGEFCDLQNMLFGWIRDNGGTLSEKVELSTGSNPEWNIRGIFATDDIHEGELIVYLPSNLRICRPDMCDTVNAIRREIGKGDQSFWLPYIKSMEEHDVDIPNVWTDKEINLFQGLYPYDWTRHTEWFVSHCRGDLKDADTMRALMLTIARSHGLGDQVCMSPFYDSLNHDNDNLNTVIVFDGDRMYIQASKHIAAGEQIFNTFGTQGVGRFVRDYGFVSPRPHLWEFVGSDGREYSVSLTDNGHGFLDIDLNPGGNEHQRNLKHYFDELTAHLTSVLSHDPFAAEDDIAAMKESRVYLARTYRNEYIYGLQVAQESLHSQLTGATEM